MPPKPSRCAHLGVVLQEVLDHGQRREEHGLVARGEEQVREEGREGRGREAAVEDVRVRRAREHEAQAHRDAEGLRFGVTVIACLRCPLLLLKSLGLRCAWSKKNKSLGNRK